ncbi:MAG: adenylate/guanylate cyclase domain-containing protein [Deltaproteobacteria bacterium]|nr:adenylate/guanylate cyclase domain-containing protein [Deltaproteobacteria bacterium]
MAKQPSEKNNPWPGISRLFRFKLGLIQILANVAGAIVCISYFLYFDQLHPLPYIQKALRASTIMMIILVITATCFNYNWLLNIRRYIRLQLEARDVPTGLLPIVQRKILNMPFYSALVSLANWLMAALIMSVYSTMLQTVGKVTLPLITSGCRVFTGVLISGVVTSAIVFFTTEIFSREARSHFFPDGGLVQTPGAFRLRLRLRLLYTFMFASFLPMIILAVLSYNKARMMLIMDPEEVISSLLYLTVFLLITGLALAMILSHTISGSIVTPVKDMVEAMTKVAEGDLTAAAGVTSNDELGILADHFNRMVEGLRDRERIKETFGRFVTPEIAQAILEHPPALGGESTEVSILFSDVRDYTTLCEELPPNEVINLLNNYFSYMVRAIEKHQGVVYQFVGDGIMAVFGAPVRLPDHATLAVKSALEIMNALEEFNTRHRVGLPPFRVGVGINTGPVVAGIIGTAHRMEYRVVGDSVNLASRIETLNKELHTDILISQATRDQLKEPFDLKEFPPVKVKGKEHLVRVAAVM